MTAAVERHHRRRSAVTVAVAAALVLAALAVDLVAGPPTRGRPPPMAASPQGAGTWYCPATAREGESAVLTLVAVGSEPSRVTVSRYRKGTSRLDEPITVVPGRAATVALRGRDARAAVAVEWTGGPAVAHWRVNGKRTTAATCVPEPADEWLLAGLDTTLGSRSLLHLFNPFTVDAVVRLVFATPSGPVRLVLTDNLVVPAGRSIAIDLNRYQPEIADLGVIVEVSAGRVVAQGEVTVDPPGDEPGLSGRALVPAAPAPAEAWTVAHARHDEAAESWLSVLNPGPREAAVELVVSDPLDARTDVLDEVSVPAGAVVRLDLAEVSKAPEFAVAVSVVNSAPVVVTRLLAVDKGDGRGLAASLGATAPSPSWALPGGGSKGRGGVVSVYNPGPGPAVVEVTAGEGTPPAWAGIRLKPNSRKTVALAAAGPRSSLPVRVEADSPVVAELASTSSGDRLRLWTALGVPASAWSGPATRMPVRLDPGLATRAPPATEPGVPPVDTDAPVVDPPATEGDGGGDRDDRDGRDDRDDRRSKRRRQRSRS